MCIRDSNNAEYGSQSTHHMESPDDDWEELHPLDPAPGEPSKSSPVTPPDSSSANKRTDSMGSLTPPLIDTPRDSKDDIEMEVLTTRSKVVSGIVVAAALTGGTAAAAAAVLLVL
eukprot:TRINITY_DN26871_c0_g1_i3.p1 TRINITY_DN26871_c0_g1~~TRINITY_DN26871_c0_g1_i3.p1  ORF type:complete len:126 (-),score=38.68 TRINITY_DN26871_c0_g1_i3:789-1133(-)